MSTPMETIAPPDYAPDTDVSSHGAPIAATFVLVNGVATVVSLTREQALAQGYALLDMESTETSGAFVPSADVFDAIRDLSPTVTPARVSTDPASPHHPRSAVDAPVSLAQADVVAWMRSISKQRSASAEPEVAETITAQVSSQEVAAPSASVAESSVDMLPLLPVAESSVDLLPLFPLLDPPAALSVPAIASSAANPETLPPLFDSFSTPLSPPAPPSLLLYSAPPGAEVLFGTIGSPLVATSATPNTNDAGDAGDAGDAHDDTLTATTAPYSLPTFSFPSAVSGAQAALPVAPVSVPDAESAIPRDVATDLESGLSTEPLFGEPVDSQALPRLSGLSLSNFGLGDVPSTAPFGYGAPSAAPVEPLFAPTAPIETAGPTNTFTRESLVPTVAELEQLSTAGDLTALASTEPLIDPSPAPLGEQSSRTDVGVVEHSPSLNRSHAVSSRVGVISARAISKSRRNGDSVREVLRTVDIDILPGEFVVVSGRSGSGKTTLLSCLAGLDSIDDGELYFEGHPFSELTESDRARHRAGAMGFVFQGFHLLGVLSTVENVELPLLVAGWSSDDARAEALAALSLVGLSDCAHQSPSSLSGGEQQRVAIARALVGEPRVVFADEPTGNLDDSSAETIAHLLGQLHADGLTVVVATHDQRLTAMATKRLEVRDGRVSSTP